MTEPEGTVFVVDDDASLRETLKDLIRSVGLRVEVSASPFRSSCAASARICR